MNQLLDSLHEKILKSKFAEEVTDAEIYALVKAKMNMSENLTSSDVPDNNVGKWISVTERLPTEEDADWNGKVLAIDDYLGEIQTYWYKVVARHANSFSHWMPLPQPPKESE